MGHDAIIEWEEEEDKEGGGGSDIKRGLKKEREKMK